jgi:hypothetical protein
MINEMRKCPLAVLDFLTLEVSINFGILALYQPAGATRQVTSRSCPQEF